MKVAIISAHTHSLINLRGDLIASMVSQGHEVIACAPQHESKLVEQIQKFGAKFQSIKTNRTGLSPISDLKYFWQLYRFLKENGFDQIITYNIKPVIFGSLAARFAGTNSIVSIIAGLGYIFSDARTIKQRLLSKIVIAIYKIALSKHDTIIFQNKDDISTLQILNIVRPHTNILQVNGSGVNLNRFPPSQPNTHQIKFLLTARLIKDKGIVEYYEAAKRLKNRGLNATFQLLGPYDTNPQAISPETVKQWTDENVIEYLGEVDDVRPILTDCSIFVLPSYYREGCPRSSLEALATGRAVITTDSVGCRDTVIDNVNGFLIPARSIDTLENAMHRFIENPSLIKSMGANSLELAKNKFDVNIVNQKIISNLTPRE